MTKHSRVNGDFKSRVVLRLHAALAVGVVACFLAVMPALAAWHPVRYAETHEAVAHRVRSRRASAQAAAGGGAAKSSKPGKVKKGAAETSRSAKPAARSSAKSRRHKLRKEDEADNDPLVVHRVSGRSRRLRRDVPRPAALVQSFQREHVANQEIAAAEKSLSSQDFARAAGDDGGQPFASGQSRPDDDERLTMKTSEPITAEVSAAPEPVTPVGKATLPQKIDSAAAAAKNTLTGHGRVKPSVLPEDHEGKVAVIDEAMQPMILPMLVTRHGRVVMPPPLKGTRDILVHQNTMADSEGLDRIQDDADLDRMRELHLLVALNDSDALMINTELPENRRYARPWTARFAVDISRAFYFRFRQPLHLSSAVRTVDYQLRLQRVNGNAAAVDGDGASPHLTGQALDFGKGGMNKMEIAWMREYLAPLMQAGKIDVEEEFQQSCFHISVYRSYGPKPKSAKLEVAREESPMREVPKVEPSER